jgi:hypothetical protein
VEVEQEVEEAWAPAGVGITTAAEAAWVTNTVMVVVQDVEMMAMTLSWIPSSCLVCHAHEVATADVLTSLKSNASVGWRVGIQWQLLNWFHDCQLTNGRLVLLILTCLKGIPHQDMHGWIQLHRDVSSCTSDCDTRMICWA